MIDRQFVTSPTKTASTASSSKSLDSSTESFDFSIEYKVEPYALKKSSYVIRNATAEDMQLLFDWGDEFHWNQCDNDIEPFLAIDPTGFFIGEVDNQLAACICTVRYDDYFYTGLYIVRKEFRGKGYGLPLFKHAMEYAKEGQVLALDAVESEISNYEKWGFKLANTRTMAFRRTAKGDWDDSLVDLKKISFEELVDFDTKSFGYSRRNYLKALLAVEEYVTLGILEGDKLKGYGILKKAHDGYRIGPFVANDKETAEIIINGLQSFVEDEDVYIEVPEQNKDAQEIMATQNWEYVSCYHKMYARGAPKTDYEKMYGVLSDVA